MQKYKVTLVESKQYTFYAKAKTPQEAEDMVNDHFHGCKYEGAIVEPGKNNMKRVLTFKTKVED